MKVSTKGRYALRVMIDLAVNGAGEFIPLKDISERQEISLKYLEQIISLLGKAGYLHSSRGNNGGYMLARRPEEYTAGDILRITEGNLSPVACANDNGSECPHGASCAVMPFWRGLSKVINEYVDGVTLADLVENERALFGADYSI